MSRDITLEETVYIMFSTRAFATGIPTTLAGTPVVSAYENDSLTQITAGITLGVDHDGVAGLHLLTIAATAANGYESGKDYHLVITTGTVGGVSVVGEVVGEFTIGRSAAAVDLANGTDGLGIIKTDTAAILTDTGTTLDARIPAALVGGRMDSDIGAKTGNVALSAQEKLDVNTEVDGALDTAIPGVPTGDSVNQRVRSMDLLTEATGAGDLAAILTDTAVIGTAGAGLTAVPWNAAWDAEVESEATDALNAYDPPTNAEMVARTLAAASYALEATVAALNNLSAAAVNAEVVDVLGTDTQAEPTGVPAATASLVAKIGVLYMMARNRIDVTASKKTIYGDDDAAEFEKDLTDDGTTYSETEANAI